MKTTVYLNKRSQEILRRMGEESEKSTSAMINEALFVYGDMKTYLQPIIRDAVREVMAEDLMKKEGAGKR